VKALAVDVVGFAAAAGGVDPAAAVVGKVDPATVDGAVADDPVGVDVVAMIVDDVDPL